MKGLSKKLAGFASAAILTAGGVHEVQAGMSVIPSINLSDYAAEQISDEKSDILYDMSEKAQEYIADQISVEEWSTSGIAAYAKNRVTDLLQEGTVEQWMQDKPLAMACLIVAVQNLHSDLTQKMTEDDLNDKYGVEMDILSAIRKGEKDGTQSYNISPFADRPVWRKIENPEKTVSDIKNKMALGFVVEEIKLKKNEPIIQSIQAFANVMKALRDDKLDDNVLAQAKAMEADAQKKLRAIDENYLTGLDKELEKNQLLYGELPQNVQIRKAVKNLYIAVGLKKVNQFMDNHYQKNGIKVAEQQKPSITPIETAKELQEPSLPAFRGYDSSLGSSYRQFNIKIPSGR